MSLGELFLGDVLVVRVPAAPDVASPLGAASERAEQQGPAVGSLQCGECGRMVAVRLSRSSPAAGSSNAPSAGSCTIDAWPATTKPTPTDRQP